MGEYKFNCKQCGECCKWEGEIYVEKKDISRAAKFLKMPIAEFMLRFVKRIDEEDLGFQLQKDSACIFLENKKCKIYPARPKQCKDFPSKWKIEDIEKYCPAAAEQKKGSSLSPK